MKKHLFVATLLTISVLFNACKKEKSFEGSNTPSTGSLKSDVTGDCLPKTVAGAYEKGVELDGTENYIEIQVDVSQGGAYLITSDTLNGISFKATGVFTNTGLQTIKLKGSGTPFVDGIANFTIFYDTTSCTVAVTTLPPGSAGPAEFILIATTGACSNTSIAGDYVINTPLTATNTATLLVNVLTIGTYDFSTIASNGMTFTGIGTFGVTGEQTLVLTGTGTPLIAGPSSIPVSLTNPVSACSFIINVLSTPQTGDYFPRTANSNWSYELNDVFTDSLLRLASNAAPKSFGANAYNIFMQTEDAPAGFDSSGYYRKSGSDYYEILNLSDYFEFDVPRYVENIFLKDNVTAGSTWTSAIYTGTVTGIPVPISYRLKYKITQKDVTVVVKSISYPNTIEVEERAELLDPTTNVWTDASTLGVPYFLTQYAKNVGMIRLQSITSSASPDNFRLELRRYTVF